MQPETAGLTQAGLLENDAPPLRAYLLGRVDWPAIMNWQSALVTQAWYRGQGSLILCEHPPLISVGRQGSYRHLLIDLEELQRRNWAVHWVNRGGGCWLHLPGQLAIYAVIPLAQRQLSLVEYLRRLCQALAAVVSHYLLPAEVVSDSMEIRVSGRPIACVGVHVRRGVSSFGAIFNIGPDLTCSRLVRTGYEAPPMTSLERECRRRIRPAEVRELLLQHLASQLQYSAVSISLEPPRLPIKVNSGARITPR
jgi:lipoyl(octanoyl) transferase